MCGMVKIKSLSRLNPYIREVNMHLELYPPPLSNTRKWHSLTSAGERDNP